MVGLIQLGVLIDLLIAAYVLLAIALPFLVVYARNHERWWSLVPGGICTIIGISFLFVDAAVIGALALLIVGGWMLMQRGARPEKAGLGSRSV